MSITTRQGEQPMTMKNPPHPGGVVLRQCIEPLGLTITDAAEALGVTRNTLSELVNGKRGISPEMAVRLAKVFGGTEEGWLVQQAQYDLAHVRRRPPKAEAAGTDMTGSPSRPCPLKPPRTNSANAESASSACPVSIRLTISTANRRAWKPADFKRSDRTSRGNGGGSTGSNRAERGGLSPEAPLEQ